VEASSFAPDGLNSALLASLPAASDEANSGGDDPPSWPLTLDECEERDEAVSIELLLVLEAPRLPPELSVGWNRDDGKGWV